MVQAEEAGGGAVNGEQEGRRVSPCSPGCSRCEAQGKRGPSPNGFGGLPVRGPRQGTRRLLSEALSSAGPGQGGMKQAAV